jgi:hypothetical protein
MSLINDALQRAKQTQQAQQPTISNLELRPRDPIRRLNQGMPWLLPVFGLIAVAVAVAGIVLFRSWNRTAVVARPSPAEPASFAASVPVPPDVSSSPRAATTLANATGLPADRTGTNTSAAISNVPPTPVGPKLQGIFFSATHPAAIISGRTVYVGDEVAEFRVAAITPRSATLVSQGKTNILTLE